MMKVAVLVALAVALPLIALASASDGGFTQISEPKALKSLLAGRRNVLIVYADTDKSLKKLTPALRQAGQEVEGVGSIAVIVCQENKETKKMCKRLDGAELPTGGAVLKHYKSGKYNKDYDRALTAVSIANFLKDPESDAPWSESETAGDVQHLDDNSFDTVIAKKKPTLVMFYAPWCGHCKSMKPHFEQAATELKKQKSKVVIAGLDAAGNAGRMTGYRFNVTGYPTIKYFENGAFRFDYNGGRTKDDVIAWLKKPTAAAPKQEIEQAAKWSDEPSDVAHLTDETFDPFMEANPSVLVMFYAPWCGHCKSAKPEYVAAAKKMKAEGIVGSLAAVDATEFPKLQSRFKVEGFPTFVYFKDGKEAWKPNTGRKEKDFIEYMRNPVEPPPPPPPEAKWSEEPSRVEHLTDESLNKYIKRQRNKHILVMFYAPWCGHCKAFKPDWTETANQLKGTNFVLAALDATEHKKAASEYGVKGFPTIKYFHGGKLAGEYDGPRTSQGLMDFFHSKEGSDEL